MKNRKKALYCSEKIEKKKRLYQTCGYLCIAVNILYQMQDFYLLGQSWQTRMDYEKETVSLPYSYLEHAHW